MIKKTFFLIIISNCIINAWSSDHYFYRNVNINDFDKIIYEYPRYQHELDLILEATKYFPGMKVYSSNEFVGYPLPNALYLRLTASYMSDTGFYATMIMNKYGIPYEKKDVTLEIFIWDGAKYLELYKENKNPSSFTDPSVLYPVYASEEHYESYRIIDRTNLRIEVSEDKGDNRAIINRLISPFIMN